jgi:glucose/mannose-6-phosphate isomerase
VGEDMLVIAASYSGNTEETLEALEHAREAGAQIAVITHGGKLLDDATTHGDILAKLQDAPQPRAGVFSAYRALVEILEAAQLIPADSVTEIETLVEPLEAAARGWAADVPESANYAKQLAQQLVGKTPIIYGGPLMAPAAYKWKIDVNENAKNTAWCGVLPEFNHNEFIGWSSQPVEKPFAVVDLLSSFEHERVQKRFAVSDRLLSGMRPASINVEAKGDSPLEHMLYLVLLGDMATTYLAYLNGVNPSPVDLVEKFKKEQADLVIMDLYMPEMDGFEASKLIKGMSEDTPIIVISTTDIAEEDLKKDIGIDYLLKKPLNIKKFQDFIHMLLLA